MNLQRTILNFITRRNKDRIENRPVLYEIHIKISGNSLFDTD